MRRKFLLVFLPALAACDFVYGVRRSAQLQVEPTPECVERVLLNTPGISSVEHKHTEAEHPLTLSGIQKATVVHSFIYQGSNHVQGVLQYTKDYKGTIEFWQASMGLNRIPPQEEITATRPVMRQIEVTLERECGLVDLADHITELCEKENCPTLP